MAAAHVSLKSAHLYPDGACGQSARSSVRGVDEDTIIVGNGSNEIIEITGTRLYALTRSGHG